MTELTSHDAEFWAARPRSLDTYTVKECTEVEGDIYQISTTNSTGFMRAKADIGAPLKPGTVFDLETVNISIITGLRVDGQWRFRLTDEDLADEARERSEAFRRRQVEQLEANKAQWWAIEQTLPDWIRARINRFREAAGEKFLLEGWGYELAVAQLAVAYAADDKATVDRLARELGTSGNQHDFAKALAKAHNAGDDAAIAESVSALSPLTGSADYS